MGENNESDSQAGIVDVLNDASGMNSDAIVQMVNIVQVQPDAVKVITKIKSKEKITRDLVLWLQMQIFLYH